MLDTDRFVRGRRLMSSDSLPCSQRELEQRVPEREEVQQSIPLYEELILHCE